MRKLLNPNFSITYHSLLSFIYFSYWSCASLFTWVNFLILLALFYPSGFCLFVVFLILSHSILNLLPLYLKGNFYFSYPPSPWNHIINMEASQTYAGHMKILNHHHSGTLSLLLNDIPLMHSLYLLINFSTEVR